MRGSAISAIVMVAIFAIAVISATAGGPANQPAPEQNPMPMEQEQPQQKTPNPQEKSQSGPKPGHSQTRMTAMLANAMSAGFLAVCETSQHAAAFAVTMQGSDRSAR